MAIKRPDVYEHNNPNLAVVDSNEVRGGLKVAANLTEKYGIPTDKLKNGTWVWVSSELKFYYLVDITNKGVASGWVTMGDNITQITNRSYNDLQDLPSLYTGWNLRTNGVQRTTMPDNSILDLVAGTNIGISYGAGGVVTINATAAPITNITQIANRSYSDLQNLPSLYTGWNLRTNGVQRTTMADNSILDLVAGANITIGYSAGGVVTINGSAEPVTYTAGNGLNLATTVFSLATPSSITSSTTNSVTTSSHTHALTLVSGDITGALGYTPVTTARTLTGSTGILIDGVSSAVNLSTNRTIAVDSTVLRESNTNTITGLKAFRRAGSNLGTAPNIVVRYEIGDDNLYKVDFMNTQNETTDQAEVTWYFQNTFNRGTVAKTLDVLSFFRGVLVTGDKNPSLSFASELRTYYAGTSTDFPVKSYHVGINQFASGVTIGSDNGDARTNITTTTKLWVNGDIKATGDMIAFSTSDKRLKDNMTKIENALEKLTQLNGYYFEWNDKQTSYEGFDYGISAQEVQALMPELVKERGDEYLHVNMVKIIPLLIESIKEIKEKLNL